MSDPTYLKVWLGAAITGVFQHRPVRPWRRFGFGANERSRTSAVERTWQRHCFFKTTMTKTLHTLLFSTGRQRDRAEDEALVHGIVSSHVEGFSLFGGNGYWKGKEEVSFQLLLATDDDKIVSEIIHALKSEFHQDSVVEIRHNAAFVIYH